MQKNILMAFHHSNEFRNLQNNKNKGCVFQMLIIICSMLSYTFLIDTCVLFQAVLVYITHNG